MEQSPLLSLSHLTASVAGKVVLHGVDLTLSSGDVHALMGPNGSGKSSLAMTLLGHPAYTVDTGASKVLFEGKDLMTMSVDERSRAGLFVAWQSPLTIPGVTVFTLCKSAYESHGKKIDSIVDFKKKIEQLLEEVGLPISYVGRAVNEGFSGGEKKRLELLQLMLLEPKLALLDEIDSGLDIDALKIVGRVVDGVAKKGTSVIIITHYKRLLDYVNPTRVSVIAEGKIVESGGPELVELIEKDGYVRNK